MTAPPYASIIGPVPDPFNMAAYVLGKAEQAPEKVALRIVGDDQATSWTYSALDRVIRSTATGLRETGIKPGDRVLMRLGNTPDFPIVYLAAILIGAVPMPTSTQLTVAEVTKIANETQPRLVISDGGVTCPDGAWPTLDAATLPQFHTLPPAAAHMGDPDRPAYIVYTSGTSGKPRPVVHAHRAVWARRMMWDGWYGLRPDDVMLHAGAFNWTYTLGTGLMDPWAMGATALIPSDQITAADLPSILKQHDVSIFAAAPGVYRRMLRSKMPALPALRHGLSAGEKLPDVTANQWQAKTGTAIYEAYGMSECSTFISTNPTAPSGSLGWPQAGRQVALIGPDGPVPDGQSGTIAVHRDDPGLMLGYLNAAQETASKFAGDWFLTGDVGRKGPDEAIHYEGRVDDMMNAGGYRVSPIEVEAVLATHPAIQEIAACEITLRADTSIIAAFYVGDNMLDEDDLKTFAADHLAAYKVPRMYLRIDHLPRGANNKILRRKLRQDWETTHGQA